MKEGCTRCGTCCRKGGPALHLQDRPLVRQGHIGLSRLYTIRVGEPVHDNVQGTYGPTPGEIIKIRSWAGRRSCGYFEENTNSCRIYPYRPAECRAMQCWDSRPIAGLYARRRLSREDLIGTVEGLWDLVQSHSARCAYEGVRRLNAEIQNEARSDSAERELLEMVRYDAHLRRLVLDKSGLPPELLPFLFGRPLAVTLRAFGLRMIKDAGRARIRPISVRG
jgi:Fe-S-cluster containining protein